MADNLQFIRDIFWKTTSLPLRNDEVWSVQGTPVVKHKALERLAVAMNIKFRSPQILRAERDEAVILVCGEMGDATEWSIGEACVNVNYRVSPKVAAYVYAMAEKRGKDRVILKLAGLHGVYSEEEADEFRTQDPVMDASSIAAEKYMQLAKALIARTKSAADLRKWWDDEKKTRGDILDSSQIMELKGLCGLKVAELNSKETENV